MRSGGLRGNGGTVFAGLVIILAFTKWSQSGSTLAVFVGGAALGAIVLDVAVARRVVGRAHIDVSSSAYDCVDGDALLLRLRVTGSSRRVSVRGAGVDSGLPAVHAYPPATAKMPCLGGPRGVFTHLEVEVSSAGVCNLLGWGQRRRLAFPEPVYVGPRPVDPMKPLPELAFTAPEGVPQPSVSGDIVRGVRPYARGDALRRVHWPATARAGELIVMEVEEPVAPRVFIVVNLTSKSFAAEQAAGRAAWLAREALRREYEVRMATLEVAGPVVHDVSSERDINRRLATAVAGPPRLIGKGDGMAATVDVSDDGDVWGS